jgi:hypothetical protein
MRRQARIGFDIGARGRHRKRRARLRIDGLSSLHSGFMEPLAMLVQRIPGILRVAPRAQECVIVGMVSPALGISESGPRELRILQLLAEVL